MKNISLICICLIALTSSVYAEDKPVRPVTTKTELSLNDIQIYANAIRIAATQCGADKELACQIGLNEKMQLEKLNTTAKALVDAQAVFDKEAEKKAKK